MSHNGSPVQESAWQQFWKVGPLWITAIVGLLTAVGFFTIGHVTASTTASPTVTVTASPLPAVTVTETVAASAPTDSATSASGGAPMLGSYSIELTSGYTVPLGPSKPTQSQFNTNGNGDLGEGYAAVVLGPVAPNKIVTLQTGHAPTFQTCSAASSFTTAVYPVDGTSFCLIEPERLVGVLVTSIVQSDVTIQVTVWRNAT